MASTGTPYQRPDRIINWIKKGGLGFLLAASPPAASPHAGTKSTGLTKGGGLIAGPNKQVDMGEYQLDNCLNHEFVN